MSPGRDPGGAADGATLTASPHTLRHWRSGPRWFWVVAAMIDDERVERRRARVLDHLGDWLRPSAPGQPHVTLAACGFDPPLTPSTPARLRLLVTGADLFRSAVYLRADPVPGDPGLELARQRWQLHDVDRAERWVPHVTVGLFTTELPLARVRRKLAPLAGLPPLPVTADIRVMAVDTRSDAGALVSAAAATQPSWAIDPDAGRPAGSRTLFGGGFA